MKKCLRCSGIFDDTEKKCPVCGFTLISDRSPGYPKEDWQSHPADRNSSNGQSSSSSPSPVFKPVTRDPAARPGGTGGFGGTHGTGSTRNRRRPDPIINPTPRPVPPPPGPIRPIRPSPNFLAHLLNILPAVLAVIGVTVLAIAYRASIIKLISTFVLWWIVGFIVIVCIARHFLQPQTMTTGATIIGVIGCICTFNVLGIGSALSCLFQQALLIGIIIAGILLALRAMFK